MSRERPWLADRCRGLSLVVLAGLVAAAAGCIRQETPPPASLPAPRELVFYDWVEDMPQSVLDAFTASTGVAVKYVAFTSQEEAVASILRGDRYDVAVIEHDFIPALVRAGRLAEIDFRQVPNFKNIGPAFRDLATDPGSRHTVPFHFGTTGLLVRTDLIQRPVRRWADLLDPRLAGKVAIREQYRELFGLTLLALGLPMNSEEPRHLDAALAWLQKLKGASFLVDVEADQAVAKLLSGEAVVLVGWAEDYHLAHAQNAAVAYVLPAEGTDLWGDSFVIPASSPDSELAARFIDFLLRPEVSAQVINEKFFANANEAALPLVRVEIRSDPVTFPPHEILSVAAFFQPLSEQGEALYDAYFKRLDLRRPDR